MLNADIDTAFLTASRHPGPEIRKTNRLSDPKEAVSGVQTAATDGKPAKTRHPDT